MANKVLTPEQLEVITHPLGYHARVLAVAGSGKSTTMAYRIKHLIQSYQIRSNAIQVLMFNSQARRQFNETLEKVDLPASQQPIVHTFHSLSFQIIGEAIKRGILPSNTQFWLADKSELIWLTVKRAITELEKAKRIPPEVVDPEEALNAIGIWKGSLTPTSRAGSYGSSYLPLVYKQYETLRQAEFALTFDDFIPLAIDLLENNNSLFQRYCKEIKHLIIDEYQDINFGQQRLIEILASEHVDIMVVGDDDQTIYEWRGACPNYIIHDFATVFNDQPVMDYRLSRSFRFGPMIAQCAANVISCNTNRVDKPLIASQAGKPGFVQVLDGGYDSIKELAQQVRALMIVDKTSPSQIIVLARLYTQMDNLEAEFLAKGIPYKVDGQDPFFKRTEINALLDYIRLAIDYQQPMDNTIGSYLQAIANKPSRMLSRSLISKLVFMAQQRHLTCQQLLAAAVQDYSFGVARWQSNRIVELQKILESLHKRLSAPKPDAGEILVWLVNEINYLAYFQDYYGKGENSDEKSHAVMNFIQYVTQLHISPSSLLQNLAVLDTTQGKPESELIIFTTIFRSKGLEYDYVIIPQCDENMLPYLRKERSNVFDINGFSQENPMSNALENERRLFYVALTRARKGVLIGTSNQPSRFLDEMQLKPTECMMTSIQLLANGVESAADDLIGSITREESLPTMVTNLKNGYLPDLGRIDLTEKIGSEMLAVRR